MSKKFGINTKSAEARARQDAVKQANDRDKQQKLEDEYWRDDDKHVQKKQQRKVWTNQSFLFPFLSIIFQNDQEQKDQEKLQKKQDNQRLLEQEEAAITASKAKAKLDLPPKKVTQAQIQQQQATPAAAATVPNGIPHLSFFSLTLNFLFQNLNGEIWKKKQNYPLNKILIVYKSMVLLHEMSMMQFKFYSKFHPFD